MPETITQALVRDHNAVMREITIVRADPRLAPSYYPGIADAIRRHSAAEEETFYSALRRISNLDARAVGALEGGHRKIATSLDALDRMPYGSPQFWGAFLQMAGLLATHVRYEENAIFPLAERELPRARQYALATRYNERMGNGRVKNTSILLPSLQRARTKNCACKNPCGCTKPNARRVRPQWYQHFMGVVPAIQHAVRRRNPSASRCAR